jgi:hypothetical protein
MITTNKPAKATAAMVAIAYSAVAAPSSLLSFILSILNIYCFLLSLVAC